MAESEASWIDDNELSSSPTGTSPEDPREPQWTDSVVPPSHKDPTLIAVPYQQSMMDFQNSNVVQFISLLKKDNKREQMVYYQIAGTCSGNTPAR
ncbi:hypothetical protein BDM02DRAFT_3106405 [Thelephora ganbajun]|uniref:Uncharacterized protein n=1 Tax=Thelephora ganbajun TaxID=370292 RepID=A0ACB6ZYF1_THEGA|nr:hypothetical protein BDM02DRAFT_3106405 [Thelephora ganbajun]